MLFHVLAIVLGFLAAWALFVPRSPERIARRIIRPWVGIWSATYTESDLTYSAIERCPCGAGLAYPRDGYVYYIGPYWGCSELLTGRLKLPSPIEHAEARSVLAGSVIAETSPRACGQTTRPTPPRPLTAATGYGPPHRPDLIGGDGA